jgi:hypothetical protein
MPNTNRTFRTPTETPQRVICSSDEVLQFALQRASRGIHLQREQRFPSGSRVAHAALFTSAQQFEKFLDADELRFEYPIVYRQLRREFDTLLYGEI